MGNYQSHMLLIKYVYVGNKKDSGFISQLGFSDGHCEEQGSRGIHSATTSY